MGGGVVGVGQCESVAVHASRWAREFRGRGKDLGEVCWSGSRDGNELAIAGWDVDEGTGQGGVVRCGAVRPCECLRGIGCYGRNEGGQGPCG
jgi:hypothetical protein